MTYKTTAIVVSSIVFIAWVIVMVRLWREGNYWKQETERIRNSR